MNPGTAATEPAGPITWPDGYRSAVALTFDLDAEAAVLATHPDAATRPSVMTHQAYGPLVGVPRLLDLLRRNDLRATFFVPGFTAERYPAVVRNIVSAGHEVGHHGYLHESMIGMTPQSEAAILDRGLEALHRVAGVVPRGFRAPMWELNLHTPELLVQRGFSYDSSLMDADVPYVLAADESRSLVEIPVHWGLDDWEQYAYLPGITGTGVIATPSSVLDMWTLEAQAMHDAGGCLVLTMHPFLSGRPARARSLEALIGRIRELDGVWITTLESITDHVNQLGLAPRRLDPPHP